MSELLIPNNAMIRVYWDDKPEMYSKEDRNKVRNYFSNKYGVPKNQINVIFRPIKINENGDTVEMSGVGIDNIMDINYQHQLFKEWIKRENITVDFDRIISLDKKVNEDIKFKSEDYNYKSWKLKYLMLDNFLSFGDKNDIDFNKLNGINVVTSLPLNQGGKCVRSNTEVVIQFSRGDIIDKLGFLPGKLKENLTIGELYDVYQKYGDLNIRVRNPYGYHTITWCGITEFNANIYRCELENGMYVEGADYHRLKKDDGNFITLNNINIGDMIQTIKGNFSVKSCQLLDEKDTLYDIQVDDVHQYYTNGIVSHNTTFSIDALMFLFFGTTTKTDKNEEIFNQYSGKDELTVKGIIELDSSEYSITRYMKRTPKRDGTGYTIKNTVNYCEILPDGEEKLLDGEDSIRTTQKIVDAIGTEKDFMTTILATSSNLEELVETLATARGKLLTRFIGLEVIEQKEISARNMLNKYSKTMKSNIYNITDLNEEITQHKDDIKLISELLKENEVLLEKIKNDLLLFNKEKDDLLIKKQHIDDDIIELDPDKLNKEINDITKAGKSEGDNLSIYEKRINEIGNVNFDENEYEDLLIKDRDIKFDKERDMREIDRLTKLNIELVNSEICPTCKRPLDDVDNTTEIKENESIINKLNKLITSYNKKISELSVKITDMKQNKTLVDERDKLEIKRDRIIVELDSLRNSLISKRGDLKRYKLNNDIIELNRRIDVDIMGINAKIQRHDGDRDITINKIQKYKGDIDRHESDIVNKNKLIETIEKENDICKIYGIYIDMVGKKGISKLVLRSVLPIINFELHRLLDEVVDFELELEMNTKNEVDFIIVKDGIRKSLKSGSGLEKTASSLALRCVLSRISNLPKPNFIGFDEILGKVANENLDYMKLLFDKIRDMYDIVLLITHNPITRDWADNIITIEKVDNISTITTK